jgi:cytochrome b subunit of formate dehydrogenase
MLGTGLLMWFTHLTPLMWRTSATFVHDWLALTVGVVLAGHIGMALADPESRRGLRTGSVSRDWAEREHALWRPHPDPSDAEATPRSPAAPRTNDPGPRPARTPAPPPEEAPPR